jgi:nicotinate dehydrogenase subunit B
VSFSAGPLVPLPVAHAQGEFGTHASHIDPTQLDSWIALGEDGLVTACTGKCDFGQGIFTAQTQLVAEELCIAVERVRLVECDTARTPDQGTTSGSQSTPTNFNDDNLALAAATAREALLQLAATRLNLPAEALTARDGAIHASGGASIAYEDLLKGKHFNLALNKAAKRRTPSQWTVLGKPVPALDRVRLMTATFDYVHHVRVPGMLHGRVVRPTTMGAALLSVDESSVAYLPGMVKVVTRGDFVGVVAETQFSASTAARLLSVRWKPGPPLPPPSRFREYLQQSPARSELGVDSGDMATELGRAHRVIEGQYAVPYQMHGSVGTSCAVADVSADHATVWSATQSAYPTRSCLAKILDLPLEGVRVIYTRGSGCYGLNGADAVSFDAAVLSQLAGRPVRLQYTREDEMLWENLGAACLVHHRAALDRTGHIRAWDRESWVANLGNRPGYDQPGNVISGMLLGFKPEPFNPGPEKKPTGKLRNQSNAVPNYMAGCIEGACDGQGTVASERVLTHTVRSPFFTGPLRSPLRFQNTFANECFMDELAAEARADPLLFRLAHLKDPRLIAVLKAATTAASWQSEPIRAQQASRREAVLSGRGLACVAYEGANGYAALVAFIDVHRASGVIRPRRFVCAIDCGPVSNPDGLRNQIEGGILQGLSRTLVEEVTWDDRRLTSTDWISYPSLRLDFEPPQIETVFVSPPGARATGAGETAITITPAAVGNAVFSSAAIRLRQLPFTPARVLEAFDRQSKQELQA